VTVTFPDGKVTARTGVAGPAGRLSITYAQPPGVLMRFSRTASVTISAVTAFGVSVTTSHYTVGFGKIDIVAPHAAGRNGSLTIYVHSRAHRPISVVFHPASGGSTTMHGSTGPHGWLQLHYRAPTRLRSGATIAIQATVRLPKGTARTAARVVKG
jgi:hypothetical protein